MIQRLNRRRFIEASAIGAAGFIVPFASLRGAAAAEALTLVTWGGPWHDAAKTLAEKFNTTKPTNFSWEFHQGGAIKILPKIKATWPAVKYDAVQAWAPVWLTMIEEGWLEPLDDLPNLRQVPEKFWTRDKSGRPVTAPTDVSNVFWGYRSDMVKKPIRGFKDLLDPSLKGLIMLRTPASYTGLHFVSMALEFGGSEKNIDPAFDFLKELAKTGNVGRVGGGDVEHINSATTGETAIGFGASTVWQKIAQAGPVEPLHKVEGSPGLKGFMYTQGWSILKGPRSDLAKEFANLWLAPENNAFYAAAIANGPTNEKAQLAPEVARYFYAPGEVEKYAYIPDFTVITAELDKWSRRFETEILPLIKKA
jgi:putative spermidine/putrescine transport system substrate-binding protein